ncbi:zinc-binding dehydrogenase [Aggregatibacter sp. 2125159857]|uniref:zinc-binding dehydrogenase n=1 Tax=uncultured Aggregatibacter sp. TaxID=470564 RepID=UPI001AE029D1|nr:zinc-binding dehydrogenase [Aggregatibacter sp. 2125159857]
MRILCILTHDSQRIIQVNHQRAVRINELWEKLGNGEIGKPIIHQVFDFNDVAKAHIEMDKGTHIGKVMLDFTLLNQ